MVQTSVTASPDVGLPGQIADIACVRDEIDCVVAEALGIKPGLLVIRKQSEGDRAAQLPLVAADDDAIMTATATSASTQTLDTEFDGVIALGLIAPASKISIVRSSHANQDAVTAVLAGLDENGVPVSENIAFADGGGDTLTSTLYYSRVTSLTIPAQAGTAGTTKIGILGAASRTLDGGSVLGFSRHEHRTKVTTTGSSDNEVYEDEMSFKCLRRGRIYVQCENAFRAGDVPMIRVTSGTGTVIGATRAHDSDSSTCVPLRNARILNTGSASGIAIVDVWLH